MDLTPKQQTSEAIRQAESILILTGQHPSVDQASAVAALAAILRKFGKKVSAVVSDNPPAAVQSLDPHAFERGLGGSRDFVLKVDTTKVEVDKLRYEAEGGKLNIYLTPFKGGFAPSDVTFGYGAFHYDLAIVLGVPTRARIDRIYEQNLASFETIPMVNLDFHRSNENYGAVNLIEPSASSLCEMLVALSESLQSGIIDAEIATALLMGIVASTDRFTATHTSPKSLTVAAQMMAAGARQQTVVRALYREGKGESRGERGGDRERGGERSGDRERSGQGQRNAAAQSPVVPAPTSAAVREPAAQPTPVVQPTPAAPAPVSVPEPPVVAPAPAAAPEMSTPATSVETAQPVAQEQTRLMQDDGAIIQPAHIEMSVPEAVQPAQMAAPQPQLAPERPQAMPVADFAAAAEMFNREPVADDAK